MGHAIEALLVAVLAVAPTARGAASPHAEDASSDTCPTPLTLELLHAAVFHLDQGDDDAQVRRDLARVHAQIEIDKAGAVWTRGFLERIEAVLAGEASTRRYESEVIRKDLHESACLPAELHARFHQSLPPPGPLPGARPRSDRP